MAWIGLVIQIIFKLPSLIKTGVAIIALLRKLKGSSFAEALAIIGDILKEILGLIPKDKEKAKVMMNDLHSVLSDIDKAPKAETLKNLREIKRQCSGVGCPSDLKR